MRKTEMAVVTGDPITALRIAQGVTTPPRPANTYHRFRLDMASALLELRQRHEALAVLLALRRVTPNWLRHQRYAKSITSSLLRSAKRTIPQQLRDLADFGSSSPQERGISPRRGGDSLPMRGATAHIERSLRLTEESSSTSVAATPRRGDGYPRTHLSRAPDLDRRDDLGRIRPAPALR
jgi:hypothetical protein